MKRAQFQFEVGQLLADHDRDDKIFRVAAVFHDPDGEQTIVTRDKDGCYYLHNNDCMGLLLEDNDGCPLDPSTIEVGGIPDYKSPPTEPLTARELAPEARKGMRCEVPVAGNGPYQGIIVEAGERGAFVKLIEDSANYRAGDVYGVPWEHLQLHCAQYLAAIDDDADDAEQPAEPEAA